MPCQTCGGTIVVDPVNGEAFCVENESHDIDGSLLDDELPTSFAFAAQLCGHDVSTVTGAADARSDHRVWDVLDGWSIQEHIAAARIAIARSQTVRP